MTARHTITVAGTGQQFSCRDDEAILPAMIHAGSGPITHGCCGGGCGVCRARIVAGDYVPFKVMSAAHVSDEDKKSGVVLLCCVQPRSDLTIARE